jgi:hypothetical protein
MLETLTPFELSAIAAEPYEHRGILHSEAALILHFCRAHGISAIIESGRARAQSTSMLAKYLPDVLVVSVEARPDHPDSIYGTARVAGFDNVQALTGDGKSAVPSIIDQVRDEHIAVLLDGPKGLQALELLDKCFRRGPHVKLGFIHDMRRLDHGARSPFRTAAEAIYPTAVFSDGVGLAPFAWMDNQILAAGGPVGPAHEREYGSYGPTIGVFFNPHPLQQQTATSDLQELVP